MLQTLMAGPEYVASARRAGLYPVFLNYIARVNAGQPPPKLPGELEGGATSKDTRPPARAGGAAGGQLMQSIPQQQMSASQRIMKSSRGSEKAMNYFQSCLQVLGLEEEVALTETALKKAYKLAAVKAHPDKGGNETDFEAVTRAYAYLTEILKRIRGGREKEGEVKAPEALATDRKKEAKQWELEEPVRLNPKKLDMNLFNKLFEQTRIPDPEEDGYGDWLKSGDEGAGGAGGPKFSGKFNRDVFNSAFAEEARRRAETGKGQQLTVLQPEALALASGGAVELGRGGGPTNFTAAPNSKVGWTDLRNAYTTDTTFSQQVAGVNVEARDMKSYGEARKKAPAPLNNTELAAIAEAERIVAEREKTRQLRYAQESVTEADAFSRMRRLMIVDGKPAGNRDSQQKQISNGNYPALTNR
jgi:curved DNA-binding protein CbpA